MTGKDGSFGLCISSAYQGAVCFGSRHIAAVNASKFYSEGFK